jgi:hypothetical protein
VFIGNSATATVEARGGAIYAFGNIVNFIKDTHFLNNKAITTDTSRTDDLSQGGAIWSNRNLDIQARERDVIFSGNSADFGSDIWIGNSSNSLTLLLEAASGRTIYMDGGIATNRHDTVIQIQGGGTVVWHARSPELASSFLGEFVDGAGTGYVTVPISHVILEDSTLKINHADILSRAGVRDFIVLNGTLDMTHIPTISTLAFRDLALLGNLNLTLLKADLAAGNMDTISRTRDLTGDGSIIVDKILLIGSDATKNSTSLTFVNNDLELAQKVQWDGTLENTYSPIFKYAVKGGVKGNDYVFTFDKTGFNPAILSSSIAAQGGAYATQMNNIREGFGSMDKLMNMGKNARLAHKFRNKYAIAEDLSPRTPMRGLSHEGFLHEAKAGQIAGQARNDGGVHDEGTAWFRPNVSMENVTLNGMDGTIRNYIYGSYFGGDLPMQELRNGWSVVHSLLGGYTGAHQAFDSIGVYQNGAMLGATSTFFKNDFFIGATANAGYMHNQANTMFGKDNFSTLTSGAAVKFGNNFEWKQLIFQPSMMLGYTFVKTFDYKTASSVNMVSDALHAITYHPEIKLIGSFEKIQPYIALGAVWNTIAGGQVKANDFYLPQLTNKPYAQYGAGVQKAWSDRFSGFLQAMFRSGGRSGVAFSAGLNIAMGKDPRKEYL